MKTAFIITKIFFISFIFSDVIYAADDISIKVKKTKISWEDVKGAVKYRVNIKDINNKIILERDVKSSELNFVIPSGKYTIRIGAINKFGKIAAWSDWVDIVIKDDVPDKDKDEKIKSADVGLKFGIGFSFFDLLPEWNDLYNDSYKTVGLNIGYSFKYIDFLRSLTIFRFLGIELDTCFLQLNGKEGANRVESDMNIFITGGNLLISTDFDYPLNLIVRGGGGLAHTEQEFKKYDEFGVINDTAILKSTDYFYKMGISMEYCFLPGFFTEIGVDFYNIKYLANDFRSLRYLCLIGIKI